MSKKVIKPMSIEEANNALAFVRPVVEDLTKTWTQTLTEIEHMSKLRDKETDDVDVLLDSITEIAQLAISLNQQVDELEDVGCCVESFDKGVVDFPSKIDGDTVMLCWTPEEGDIAYYHKLGGTADDRLLISHVVE